MADQDPIDEFIALPQDKQLSTLQGLAPDKQNALLAQVKQRKSAPPATSDAPGMLDPHGKWNFGDLFRGAGSGIYNMIAHPLLTGAGMVQGALASGMSPMGEGYPSTAATGRPEDLEANKQVQQEAQQGQTEQAKQMAAHPVFAAGSILGPALLTHGVTKLAKVPFRAAKTAVEGVSGTSPQTAADLAKTVAEKNAKAVTDAQTANQKAAQTHLEDTQDALQKTREAEDLTAAANRAKAEQARAKHAADLQEVGEHNQRVTQQHATKAAQVQSQNAALDQTLEMRKAKEAELQQKTNDYYAQEDATKARAKSEENAAWKPWRDKTQNVTVDGAEIADPLKKIAAISPDVQRALKQFVPSAADALPDSQFAIDRQQIMQGQGMRGSYESLPPEQKVIVDKIATSAGFEPEPIDFDPQPGRAIPLEQIHRVKAILGQYLGSGRYEGPLLGEMKQVFKVLDQAETRASVKAGALEDLQAAKEATRTYQKAFGRERHLPTTQDEIREKTANPEAYREREDETRLNAARQYDPTLADAYEGVKSAREDFKKLPSEESLRKMRKQVPAPPSAGDLRTGYQLKTPPNQPAVYPDQAVRTAPPDRPADVVPTQTKISPEDLQQAKAEAVGKKAQTVRERGTSRGLVVGLGSVPVAIGTAAYGHPLAALVELGTGPGIYSTARGIANALENPRVVKMLSKVTAADIEKVPPELRSDALKKLAALSEGANAKGISLSPVLKGLIGLGATGAGLPSSHPLSQSQPQ